MSFRERLSEWKGRLGRQRSRRLLLLALVLLAAAAVWFFFFRGAPEYPPIEASGTVEARQAHVGFKASGRIEEILVEEGDHLSPGQVIAMTDRAELEARRQAAIQRVAQERARLQALEAGFRPEEIAEARAAVEAQREQLEMARAELARTGALFEVGAVAEEEFEQDQTEAEVAEAQLQQAQADLRRLEAGYTAEEIAEREAALRGAQADLAEAEAALGQTILRAPFAGVISVRHRTEGEIVSAGQPVVTIMDRTDRWVRAYVAEDEIGRVHLGQRARITSDTYEDEVYAGVVTFIAEEAEFTPRNIQTEEERVKLVYAIEVTITHDPAFHLHPGIPADVVLEPRPAER